MSTYALSKDELITHLGDQIDFMIASAISYDNGFEGESKRLAAIIRVLIHDTKNCSALLTQLNRMNILFYDSASIYDPHNRLPSNCLAMIRLAFKGRNESTGDYVAPLDDVSPARSKTKKVSFDRWWRTIIMKDIGNNTFSRKDLILTVANKEGGAHVDPKLDPAYANLTRFNSLAWKIYSKNEREDMGNPVPAAIRQITHEVIKTLKEGVLDLFAEKDAILNKFELYEEHCLKRSK